LTDEINSTGTEGDLVVLIMEAPAEFDCPLTIRCAKAGLSVAKKRGKRLAHTIGLTPAQVAHSRRKFTAVRNAIGGMTSLQRRSLNGRVLAQKK
jgi:hypothetical protein